VVTALFEDTCVITVIVLGLVIGVEGVVVVGEVIGVTGIPVEEEVDGVVVVVVEVKEVEVSVEEEVEVSMGGGARVVELVVVVDGKRVGGLVDDVVVDGGGGSGLEAEVVVGGTEDGGRDIIGDDSVGLDRLQHQIKKNIYITYREPEDAVKKCQRCPLSWKNIHTARHSRRREK